jgi:hypothetical protein
VNRTNLIRIGAGVLILFLAGAVVSRNLARPVQRAEAKATVSTSEARGPATARPEETEAAPDPEPASGKLKVWVPAGIIGDDYWIYLDGRIASAPPRGTTDPKRRDLVVTQTGTLSHGTGDGWEIWGRDGMLLRMHHENYDNLISYINSTPGVSSCSLKKAGDSCPLEEASRDGAGMFRAFEISVQPDKYTVEVEILSPGNMHGNTVGSPVTFPFVITRKYVVDVGPRQAPEIYVAVPDGWSETRLSQALMARRLCPQSAAPPDDIQLQGWLKQYMDDPVVKGLRGADTSSKGVVLLDLPAAQGGEREFDGSQVLYIADAISARGYLPDHREVQECRELFPQFSRSYAAYDKTLSVVDNELERFHKLGRTLGSAYYDRQAKIQAERAKQMQDSIESRQ